MLNYHACVFVLHGKCLWEVNELPNIKSAKKRVLITEKKTMRNAAAKSALRTSIKKARTAVVSNEANAAEKVNAACIKIDKAAAKGLIHKNTAARKKSRLVKAYQAASAQ